MTAPRYSNINGVDRSVIATTTPTAEMAAFDALPRVLRDKLNEIEVKGSSEQVLEFLQKGVPIERIMLGIDRSIAKICKGDLNAPR